MKDFLDSFRQYPKDGKRCVLCGNKEVEEKDFVDVLSFKEFHISGMCQICQDCVFDDTE
jgi:hypothetical protein